MIKEFSIIDAPLNGLMLIDAGAGTGKTFTISSLYVRLLIEKGYSVGEILVVTYTEAAAEDLKSRIRQRIIEAIEAFGTGTGNDGFLKQYVGGIDDRDGAAVRRLTAALRTFDEAAVFTIHGFCRRVLSEHSLESEVLFESELITDQHDLLKEISEDFFRKNFYTAPLSVVSSFFKDFAPSNLMKRIGNIHAREEIRIIPEIDGANCLNKLDILGPEYDHLFRVLCGKWHAKRKNVAKTLLESESLNRRKYGYESVGKWLGAMDRLTSLIEPPCNLFKEFSKFTSSVIADSIKKGTTPPSDDFFDLCQTVYDKWFELKKVLDDYGKYLERDFYLFVRAELKKRKEAAGCQSFDDLLTDLHQALQGGHGKILAKAVRGCYPAAMIDEFQDTDPIQYEIFSKIFKGQGDLLYLIGDPKQAIYSFRGADIFAYIKAIHEVGSRYTLAENWRSIPGLVEAVNAVFSGSKSPFIFDEIGFDPARAAEKEHVFLTIDNQPVDPFKIWVFGRDQESLKKLNLASKGDSSRRILSHQTEEICRLLELGRQNRAFIGDRALVANDLAILVRTNREARNVQQSLAQAGVASVINSSESLYASWEAVELRLILQAILDAGDQRKARSALATRIIGAEGRLLDTIKDDDGFLVDWLVKFKNYRDKWTGDGFAAMFGSFMENEHVRSRLLRLQDGERALTNLLHLHEILHLACEEHDLGMAGLAKYLDERISSIDASPNDEQQLRLESDADLVQIVTIHKSKGLQYPVVFCPFCWTGSQKDKQILFHDLEEDGELKLDIGSKNVEASRRHAVREELAENLRLFYVALTRAINCCFMAWGAFNGAGTSAPAYLFHGGSGCNDDFVGGVDYLKNLGDEEIAADLKRLTERSAGNISLEYISATTAKHLEQQSPLNQVPGEMSCRKFTGSPSMDWRVSSFSALSRKFERSTAAWGLVGGEEGVKRAVPSYEDIKHFPKGAAAGSFLHSLLEDLDFSAVASTERRLFLEERLIGTGYDPLWEPALSAMIDKLLYTPLDPDQPGLVLADIGNGSRLNEMEFYFPLDGFNPAALGEMLESWEVRDWPVDKIRGFMKGYIDLIFCHNDKFYIVDWKSNFLGESIDDYLPDKLRKVMAEEHYFLQYLIYSVALHRYLGIRLPSYDFEKNFGGVFYVFLRGIGGCGQDAGVFRDRPSFSLIHGLSSLFGE